MVKLTRSATSTPYFSTKANSNLYDEDEDEDDSSSAGSDTSNSSKENDIY